MKGCVNEEELKTDSSKKYDSERRCYASQLTTTLSETGSTTGIPADLLKALNIENKSFKNVSTAMQNEYCVCQGSFCNSGNAAGPAALLLILFAAAAKVLF